MREKFIRLYMGFAEGVVELSYCKRRLVGCVIVTDDNVITIGYNGTAPGEPNVCEGEDGLTLPNVIHAEDNAIRKFDNLPWCVSAVGASLFVTAAPCLPCAKKIVVETNIHTVYYRDDYRCHKGINYLESSGIKVVKVDMTT